MSTTRYPHLAARVFNTPLLIHPQKLDAIVAGLGSRLLGASIEQAVAALAATAAGQGDQPVRPGMFSTRRGEQAERGYRIVDGVAVLNISGALVHRSQFLMADSSFLLGYNDLAADLEDAMDDSEVHAVLQVYDSPGGEAQGAFEYADRVFGLRGKKPLVAICDGMAASAAYLGASAADEVVATATGYAGSIGVVMRHVDLSRALANDGIAITHIYAGDHKVDGNPFEPLPSAVRADFQAEIDSLMGMFVSAVERNRGITADAIRRTQARCFQGVAGVGARLADRIATTDQLITELAALRARSFPAGPTARFTANEGASMSGITPGGQPAASNAPATAPALTQEHVERARTEGHAAGVQAERERASGIFAHEAATGRTALAIQCVSTGLSVEQAGAILAASPATPAAASTPAANAFAAAMGAVPNPAVSGVDAGADTPQAQEAAAAAGILTLFRGGR
ncbi:S49 family peptidase [uncultured Xylophilus sp.]|uniref:S49 family peptidase n=1 Tax=uncultured Xylophilus sp. TaxID=296832 RepID=UPI0025D44F9A|nr:S49 family peptidase [uncultured Xylophilus sp.]